MAQYISKVESNKDYTKKLEDLIPPQEILKDYVHYKLPDRPIPEGDELKHLNEIREKAYKNYSICLEKKEKVLELAKKKYGENRFKIDTRYEPMLVPYMKDDETVNKYLEGYLGNNVSDADRMRQHLRSIKDMVLSAAQLPDKEQSDEELAQNFGTIQNQFGASVDNWTNVLEKIATAEKNGVIEKQEADELRKLRDQYEKLFFKITKMQLRMNIIFSPLYPYIGVSDLPYSEKAKLADIENLPEKYREEGEPHMAIGEFSTDFRMEYSSGYDFMFQQDHKDLFGNTFKGFCTELGTTEKSYMLGAGTIFVKNKNEEWFKTVRNESGLFELQKPTEEERESAAKIYEAMTSEDNIKIIETMNIPEGHAINIEDGSTIPGQVDNHTKWKELLNRGGHFVST